MKTLQNLIIFILIIPCGLYITWFYSRAEICMVFMDDGNVQSNKYSIMTQYSNRLFGEVAKGKTRCIYYSVSQQKDNYVDVGFVNDKWLQVYNGKSVKIVADNNGALASYQEYKKHTIFYWVGYFILLIVFLYWRKKHKQKR